LPAAQLVVEPALPAYNTGMKTALRPIRLRSIFAAVITALPLAVVMAQTQAPSTGKPAPPVRAESPPSTPGRGDPTIERIRTEDAGSRIDELRVGGETKQISVQPKTAVPAYEVKPPEGARGTPPPATSNDTNGSRVWNFFKF
jgi:hypothetical protein